VACGTICWSALVLLQHDFGGLDHRGNCVTHLQFHFIRAALRDYAFDQILARADDNVSHDAAELNFYNFTLETVPR
jgi:hypothetical protein